MAEFEKARPEPGYGPSGGESEPGQGFVISSRLALFLIIANIVLLAYGILFPLTGWRPPEAPILTIILSAGHGHLSKTDLLTNLIVFMPMGALIPFLFRKRGFSLGIILFALILGGALSFGLECLQAYLPQRVSSIYDIVLNAGGAALAAGFSLLFLGNTFLARRIYNFRSRHFISGSIGTVGLVAFGLWVLSQLSPLVPSIDIGNLKDGLKPLWHFLNGEKPIVLHQALTYFAMVSGLGFVMATLSKSRAFAYLFFLLCVGGVLALKVPIIGRQLSAEALAGSAAGLILVLFLIRAPRAALLFLAGILFIASYLSEGLLGAEAASGAKTLLFNWVPFQGHMNTVVGMIDILWGSWLFLALGYIFRSFSPRRKSFPLFFLGGIGVCGLAFYVEWSQQFLPGRYPDITDVLLAALAWIAAWCGKQGDEIKGPRTDFSKKSFSSACILPWLLFILAAAGLIGPGVSRVQASTGGDNAINVPAADELPAVSLPGFNYAHPRLPAPGKADIEELRRKNPGFLRALKADVRARRANLGRKILLAYMEPENGILDNVYTGLMSLEFTWRGHEQGNPLAQGYDWLYDYWTPDQRAALREKLALGCAYLIKVIRAETLSPFNVYLYNSPFQSLMACSLALYGDHAAGEDAMRFTNHYWKDVVLPVWRLIMGRNGGWHEGGEYVGVGIGQAAYRVPAMWRKATGEDIFSTESGLRGFLDFLVYRTRPDGTCFRWGDARHFKREVPDRVALAIEYGHKAAYSLGRKPRFEPTSWPWGPLPREELYDPEAVKDLPLSRYFDGLGLLVGRSDWSDKATYVTFKAGDNFWSHCHLDQGAFTVYKGGALAIDSGLYGPKYGSAHHMNYTYQTIAHNTVTVFDPGDDVPGPADIVNHPNDSIPGLNQDTRIANDGGQRRIGSGWGIESAPLDLAEWWQKDKIYHTGEMLRVFQEDGLMVGVADVTPAYTNALSGSGTFSGRTRRVERFWRTFAYDRVEDVVIVFDRVISTRPEFAKTWLLHAINEPVITSRGFEVKVEPGNSPGHSGGELLARVIAPEDCVIRKVGGPDAAFMVDGVNYGEGGEVRRIAAKDKSVEPGRWRIEVEAAGQAAGNDFIILMEPVARGEDSDIQVHGLDNGGPGCVILGKDRTTRWVMAPDRNGVTVQVSQAGGSRTYDISY